MNELNKKIAELKGLYVLRHEKSDVEIICLDPANMFSTIKDWQNNIADAWKLFEELPIVKMLIQNADCFFIDIPILGKEFKGNTAPEAICKAYIAWMKSKRLKDGTKFKNSKGDWIKIEINDGFDIHYNSSHAIQWAGGQCRCSIKKFKKLLIAGGYK